MNFDTMTSEEQVSYLIKPILKVLKSAGGQILLNLRKNSQPRSIQESSIKNLTGVLILL